MRTVTGRALIADRLRGGRVSSPIVRGLGEADALACMHVRRAARRVPARARGSEKGTPRLLSGVGALRSLRLAVSGCEACTSFEERKGPSNQHLENPEWVGVHISLRIIEIRRETASRTTMATRRALPRQEHSLAVEAVVDNERVFHYIGQT